MMMIDDYNGDEDDGGDDYNGDGNDGDYGDDGVEDHDDDDPGYIASDLVFRTSLGAAFYIWPRRVGGWCLLSLF